MKRKVIVALLGLMAVLISFSFREQQAPNHYRDLYFSRLQQFRTQQDELMRQIALSDAQQDKGKILAGIQQLRRGMKGLDFWLRYLEPSWYKKVNGPLPVEWETEVFEKFEKPYKREGAGLTLAALYLDEEQPRADSVRALLRESAAAMAIYNEDTVTEGLKTYHQFYLCNRLYLLNLAAIYTTGFECPDPAQVIPELKGMLGDVRGIYTAFNESFPETPLYTAYLGLYDSMTRFVAHQPDDHTQFDHYTFIRDFVNPLFVLNQEMVREYKVVSRSMGDYSLNKSARSIFDKTLYYGQNAKGIFRRVTDTAVLAQIDRLGKLLFYDPILSGNNMRSCASCHKPDQFMTDTMVARSQQFNRNGLLPRNTPSLVNAEFNHLIMQDGRHFTLQHQTVAVVTNTIEMNSDEAEAIRKVLSCKEYKDALNALLAYTPQEPQVTFEHIASALTYYYSKFSRFNAPFDDAMNHQAKANDAVIKGFNVFMGKAQCGTCHFVPQFNGVKPPYIGSEFEVLGVPADTGYHALSADKGRYEVNPARETMNAFRTGTVRNAARTMPYMHNGVFRTLEEVIDFYDKGGGAGRGLVVDNQTLSSDSLKLTQAEKRALISFIGALSEPVVFEERPGLLPVSRNRSLNQRKPGGIY